MPAESGPAELPDTDIGRHAEQWLQRLAGVRNCSPHTIRNYRRDLIQFLAGLKAEEARLICEADIRNHLARLRQRQLKASSIARKLSSLRCFLEYLVHESLIPANPAADVQAPKRGKPLPKALDTDQINALLLPRGNTPLDLRDQALFELLYSSGLRLAELCAVRCGDLDLREGMLRVQSGKGRKTRDVPVGSRAVAAIRVWLDARQDFLAPDGEDWLFLSSRGKRMHAGTVQARLNLRRQQAGIPVHVHPHMLRHSCASHVLESSGDLRAVQELLGHASLSTTQIYTRLDFQHLSKVYDAAHPRASLKKDSDPLAE